MGTNKEFVNEEYKTGWTVQRALYVIAILLAKMLDKNKK